MKKLIWIISLSSLLILAGCNLSSTNNINPDSLDYAGELTVAWVWPEVSFESTVDTDTLVLKKTFEDHSDHIFISKDLWSKYLNQEIDCLPWNLVIFSGLVKWLDAAAWNRYYQVLSIDSLEKTWNPSKEDIVSLLDRYSYCESDSDCVGIYGKCPLPCQIAINTKFSWAVDSIINNFRDNQESQCMYKCMEIKSVKCNDKYKCEVK